MPKGAKGTIAVAVGEGIGTEPGHRLMDILIDGRVRASRIDPIAVAGGKHRLAVIACEAEDLDGDGLLHVQIVASKGSPDRVTLDAGLWWFAGTDPFRRASGHIASARLRVEARPVHRPRFRRVALEGAVRRADPDGRPEAQRAGRVALRPLRLGRRARRRVRRQCPTDGSPAAGVTSANGSGTRCSYRTAFAPLDDDQTIRDVFENYWHTIDHNPEAPKGSFRYGMVPCYVGEWPPLGFSQIPIVGWGCRMVYRQTNDRALVERALPYLVLFDKWYSTERDVDGDGLIEFGAYKSCASPGWSRPPASKRSTSIRPWTA